MRTNTDSINLILRKMPVPESQQDQVTEGVKGMQHLIEECHYKKLITTCMHNNNLGTGKATGMRMVKK